jgi:hypothetical protein
MVKKMDTFFRLVATWLAGFALWLVMGLLTAAPLMLLWNWLIPTLFGLPEVGYLEAFGLLFLTKLLFLKTEVNTTYDDS